jgi:hypothetical protein
MLLELKSTFNVILNTSVDSIKILNKDGIEVYKEVECNNEEITYFNWYYRTNADSEIIEETPEADKTREPFTLIAEKTGYQTLEIPNITVTPGEPTIIRGAMVKKEPVDKNSPYVVEAEIIDTLHPTAEIVNEIKAEAVLCN